MCSFVREVGRSALFAQRDVHSIHLSKQQFVGELPALAHRPCHGLFPTKRLTPHQHSLMRFQQPFPQPTMDCSRSGDLCHQQDNIYYPTGPSVKYVNLDFMQPLWPTPPVSSVPIANLPETRVTPTSNDLPPLPASVQLGKSRFVSIDGEARELRFDEYTSFEDDNIAAPLSLTSVLKLNGGEDTPDQHSWDSFDPQEIIEWSSVDLAKILESENEALKVQKWQTRISAESERLK